MRNLDGKKVLEVACKVAVPLGAAAMAFINAMREQKEKEEYEALKKIVFGDKENK